MSESARITGLEEKLAFVERHAEQLDVVVRDLAADLADLRREVSRLQVEMTSRFDDLERGPNDESSTS